MRMTGEYCVKDMGLMKIEFGKKAMGRSLKLAGLVLVAGVLGACSSGSLFGSGEADSSLANASVGQNVMTQAALPAIATECPPIKVRAGGEALFSYAKNKIGDARALNFQAMIDKQSRNCVVSNGLITVKMGVVGRVLLGPVGTKSQFTLPLRFVVERDEVAVFSQKYDIPVVVTPPNQSEEFVKVVENVAIPYLGGENIVIWVGFDTKT